MTDTYIIMKRKKDPFPYLTRVSDTYSQGLFGASLFSLDRAISKLYSTEDPSKLKIMEVGLTEIAVNLESV